MKVYSVFIVFLLAPFVSSYADTLCTKYEDQLKCGFVTIMERPQAEDWKPGISKHVDKKFIGVSNAHLTNGSEVFLCKDNAQNCVAVNKQDILSDNAKDIAVFEIPMSSAEKIGVKANAIIEKGKTGEDIVFSYTDHLNRKTLAIDQKTEISKESGEHLISPHWKEPVSASGKEKQLEIVSDVSTLRTFVSSPGISGSALVAPAIQAPDRNTLKAVVTGYHRHVRISQLANGADVRELLHRFLSGHRGRSEYSEKFDIVWHYDAKQDILFRSVKDGAAIEALLMTIPSGGSSFGDGGGSSFGDGGGSSFGDGGGSSFGDGGGSSFGDGGGTPCRSFSDTDEIQALAALQKPLHHMSIFPGVGINGKRVIAFKTIDAKPGRLIHADWNSLMKFLNGELEAQEIDGDDREQLKQIVVETLKKPTTICSRQGHFLCIKIELSADKQDIIVSVSEKKKKSQLEMMPIGQKEMIHLDDTKLLDKLFEPLSFDSEKHKMVVVFSDLFFRDLSLDPIRKGNAPVIILDAREKGVEFLQ